MQMDLSRTSPARKTEVSLLSNLFRLSQPLLDDCPLFDERSTVLDPVDHHFGSRRNCPGVEPTRRDADLGATVLIGNLARTGQRNFLRHDCGLTLDILVIDGGWTRQTPQRPPCQQCDHAGEHETTASKSEKKYRPWGKNGACGNQVSGGAKAGGEGRGCRQIEERGRLAGAVSLSARALDAVQHRKHGEDQSPDERDEKDDAERCYH